MKHMRGTVKVVGFDADDTLWENENHFQEVERRYCDLLSGFGDTEAVSAALFRTEMGNMALYGYGVKAFTLSMVENALGVSEGRVEPATIAAILGLGKELLSMPVRLLEGVEETLSALSERYRLVVVTKGDLLDQERKLARSGLERFFHHVEIVSEKDHGNYRALLHHLDLSPEAFAMVGNSLRSDILPVLELGGFGIHIPFHTTWKHEEADVPASARERFVQAERISDLSNWL